MKKNKLIRPTGLKGQEQINRIKVLMGESVDAESKTSVVELTKIGPDGKAYGIVRENHLYFIKLADKTSELVAEDFNYIGGLQNKTKEAYPTYAKAIKQLNLKFLSINESEGGERVNVFESDKLMKEDMAIAAGSFGFVEEEVVEEETIEEVEDMNGKKAPEDKKTSGDNLDGDFEENPKASSTNQGDHKAGEQGHDTEIIKEDDVELTEDETLIDNMVEGIEPVEKVVEPIKENKLKISRAFEIEENEEKLAFMLENISEKEALALVESLKKKA